MSTQGKIKTLFSDKEKTEALFPRTKVSAISDSNGTGLDAILDSMVHIGDIVSDAETAPVNADTLGGRPAEDFVLTSVAEDLQNQLNNKAPAGVYATEAYVANKIAEAKLDGGDTDIDLSGYATKDDLANIQYPVRSVNSKTGAVTLNAADVNAIPKSGGDVTGWINFTGTTQGVKWKTTDGTEFRIRPYTAGNLFQITRVDTAGKEHATVNINNEGQVSFGEKALPINSGGTGATTAADARTNLGITPANIGAATSGHTHNYAGSSSAGGAATSAAKLNTNAGGTTQPVYFANGVPVATTYTLGASVPSGAKFTDTVYTHPSYTAKSSGLYKVTVDGSGHVSAATAVAKADITALGIPSTNTTYSAATTSAAGLMSAADKTKLNGIASGANAYTHPSYTAKSSGLYKVTVDSSGHVSGTAAVAKADITALGIPAQDTTYSAATTSANGLMTAAMVTKLNGIAAGANAYTLPTASSSTLGGVKTTSTVSSTSGLTACPIIGGVPYYKDTNNTYSLSSFGITATATELNYTDGVTSNIQTQLNGKAASSHTHDDRYFTETEINTKLGGKADATAAGLKTMLANGATVLSSNQYGTSLPSAGTAGRIFFKKVT